jgi:cysteine desulfurase/selenocysteine lyase
MIGTIGRQEREAVDTLSIRQDFPALMAREQDGGVEEPGQVYLDNAATTHKPAAVLAALDDFYQNANANPYRGLYRASLLATQRYQQARQAVADFINARFDEIVFTRNTTEAINRVAFCHALNVLKEGDEIALPISEHHSNLVPWQQVCERTGATLVFLNPDSQGRLSDEEIGQKIGPRTRLVTFAWVSHVLGTIYPVAQLVRRAHDVGAFTLLDCAQGVAHLPLDVAALDVDFAAFSGHKMYGPMGIGVLYGKRRLLKTLPPFLYGGEMIDQVRRYSSSFASGPERFEAGTPDVAGAAGLAAAIGYLEGLGFTSIMSHERLLASRLLEGLRSIPAVRIHGNSELAADRTSLVSFSITGAHPQDIAVMLDEGGIAIRVGTQCAQPLHRFLGVAATCRVSPGIYNTAKDIDRFLTAISDVRRRISRRVMALFP